jgi:hypothetical protein
MSGWRTISPVAEQEKPPSHEAGTSGDAGTTRLGCANVLAALSGALWTMLFFRAANHYSDVAKYGYPDFTGAWDFWVYLPLVLAIGSFVLALVVNFLMRSWAPVQIAFSFMALVGVFPYLVMTGGGV